MRIKAFCSFGESGSWNQIQDLDDKKFCKNLSEKLNFLYQIAI